ncbi:hypothetical protein BDZ45DRAFT_782061 [Acephala macrosclerotiorum]|nr:hypothetical protein BDZ45DRAFT_782061 [Acephala macrosclerotiorum]
MGGREQYRGRGPILVMRRMGSVNDAHLTYANVEASDIDAVKKHFTDQKSTKPKLDEDLDFTYKDPDPRFRVPNGVKGVLISCFGDMNASNQAEFREVSLSYKDSVFMGGARISSVSRHMGLILRLPKTREGSSTWWKMKSASKDNDGIPLNPFDSSENTEPWLMLVNAGSRVDSDTWGHIEFQTWDNGPVGSVVVAGQDKKPLAPRHVEVFESFCRNIITPAIPAQGEKWENFWKIDMDKERTTRRLKEREALVAK